MQWSEFVEGVACGSLNAFGFSEAFSLQNLNLLGTDGSLFMCTFEDPSRVLPDEVHAKLSQYSVLLKSVKTGEVLDKWSWDSLNGFFVGKSPKSEDEMETFYLVHETLGQYIFECDDALLVLNAFKGMKEAYLEHKAKITEQEAALSDAQKSRIKATFHIIGEVCLCSPYPPQPTHTPTQLMCML